MIFGGLRIRHIHSRKLNDKGYTLVEAIVVISIIAVVTGMLSLGISLMFSRDAQQVAVKINDEMAETRMLSMSQKGKYTLLIHMDSDTKGSYVQINKDGAEYKKIAFTNRDVLITSNIGSDDVTVEFDSANGSVKKINGAAPAEGGIYFFTVEGQKGSKKQATVTLVAATGRHYTDK